MSPITFNACLRQWEFREVRHGRRSPESLAPEQAQERAAHEGFLAFIAASKSAADARQKGSAHG